MPKRKYYEADERYRHIHDQNLIWFSNPSPIVADTLANSQFQISTSFGNWMR